MSFDAFLADTVIIERLTDTAGDNYSGKGWSALATVQGALGAASSPREINMGKRIAISTHQLMLPTGVDVTEADRIVIGGRAYNVLLAENIRGHHMELSLESAR